MLSVKDPSNKKFRVDSSIADEWTHHCFSGEPANRTEAERHIKEAFRQARLIVPQKFLWLNSPFQGAMALPFVENAVIQGNVCARDLSWGQALDWLKTQLKNMLGCMLDKNFTSDYVLSNCLKTFTEMLVEDVNWEIREKAKLISDQVRSQGNHISEFVHDQLYTDVLGQIWNMVTTISRDADIRLKLTHDLNDHLSPNRLNSFAGYLYSNCYLDCFLRNLHIPAEEVIKSESLWDDAREKSLAEFWAHANIGAIKSILEANKYCGYWWSLRGIVIATEKHSAMHLDEEQSFHCENGMAIQFPDGWGVYAWKGIRVQEKVIMAPETLTVMDIDLESNAEIRRIMLERFGWSRYLTESGANPVQADNYGTLYRREFEEGEPLVMVKVKNKTPEPDGSFKDYVLRVPPDIESAHQAVAWTFAMRKEEYQPLAET